MECCGYDRTTPFCPMCGQTLTPHPLGALLTHCQQRVVEYERRVARAEEWRAQRQQAELDTNEKNLIRYLAKWSGWAKALKPVVASIAETPLETRDG